MKHSAQGSARAREGLADESLLVGFGAEDPVTSLAFVQHFQAAMFGGLAVAVVGDAGLAEDVTRQAFERVWGQVESDDPCRAPVRTWLMTIVRNLAVDTVRVRRPYPLEPH
jgi:RNA polymerase sigma-70 factor (ECF subfamily)